MAITLGVFTLLSTSLRNALSNALNALCNTGAGAPHLVIQSSGGAADLIDFELDGSSAFGASDTGAITLDIDPAITATAGNNGAPAQYIITDSDGATIATGLASGDAVVSGLEYAVGSFICTTPAAAS